MSPQQVEAQRYAADEERALQYARMTGQQRGLAGMMQGGAGLARLGAGAMGMVDPQVEAARQQQEAMRGVSFDNPESIRAKARELAQSNPDLAARLGMLANQREGELSQIGLRGAQADKARMPSWKIKTIKVGENKVQDVQWDETGQYADVMLGEPYKDDGRGAGGGGSVRYEAIINPATNEEKMVHVSQLNQYLSQGWQQMKYSSGVAGRVAAAREASKGEAKGIVELADKVEVGKSMLPKIDDLIGRLEKGDINVGPAAELKQAFDSAKVMFLQSKAANKTLSNTQILESMMGSDVFGLIQSLGIGARGMDTPAEREFLLKVMSGEKSLTRDTLLEMARMRKASINRDVMRYNDKRGSGEVEAKTGSRSGKSQSNRIRFDAQGNIIQ